MATVGRNAPCPCGSGKKYKKCCAGQPAQTQALPAELARESDVLKQRLAELQPEKALLEDEIRLDKLSNSIVDLVEQKRFDQALAGCEQLLRDYPEVIDGIERFALVHEAREEWALAADFYRRALAFTQQDEQRDGFDEEGRAYFRKKIAEAETRAAAR
jgi:tetratricopeptide (TPR) repeat protein